MIEKISTKKNILIVDDDEMITQMLTMLLETRGYHIRVAHTARDAYKNIASSNTTDLILLDLVLPDQEGFEVCRKLKENQDTRQIPIIVLSGKMLSEYKVECLYLGADDYLTKPFDYEELVARMEAVLRRASLYHGSKSNSNGEEAIVRELRRIIEQELIVPFFQPIIMLETSQLFGLEVLSRPNTNSILSNPEILFNAALEYGVYHEMEMLSWKKALGCASQFPVEKKLFLNCNPYLVESPKFDFISSLFEENGYKTTDIFLEITERSAIGDYKTFFEHLSTLRNYGFKFAVDDVGGGYASLESIVETRPEVVKIDRHIINGLSDDAFKKSIVKFIVNFCRENHILSIAEGIETKIDLEIVRKLGVDAVQGYYIHRPAPQINRSSIQEAVQLAV